MSSSAISDFEESSQVSNSIESSAISTVTKPKSIYDKYFQKTNDGSYYVCQFVIGNKSCGKRYKVSGSSKSGLKRHLESNHGVSLAEHSASQQQRLNFKNGNYTPFSAKNADQLLLEMIVENNHAFALVGERKFISYSMCLSNGQYNPPHRTTIARRIIKTFKAKRRTNMGFVGITAHWTDVESKQYRHCLLDFVESNVDHSGAALADLYVNVLRIFGLAEKTRHITTDNASNNTTMVDRLSELLPTFNKTHHIRCFAHVLNLATQDLLSKFDPILKKLRKTLKMIRKSSQRRERFLQLASEDRSLRQNDIKPKIPPRDMPVRWNSTYLMIVESLKFRSILDQMTYHYANLKPHQLSNVEWGALEKLLPFLKILYRISTNTQSVSTATLPSVVPLYNLLLDRLERMFPEEEDMDELEDDSLSDDDNNSNENTDDDDETGSEAEEDNNLSNRAQPVWTFNLALWERRMRNGLKLCYGKIRKHYQKVSLSHSLAILLEPTLRLDYMRRNNWEQEWIDEGVIGLKALHTTYKTIYDVSMTDDNSTSKPADDDDIFSEIGGYQCGTKRTADGALAGRNEVDNYLKMVISYQYPELSGSKLLEWWIDHQKMYPILARIAFDYLSIPATSAPVEREFSGGRDMITEYRGRLKSATIRAALCLRSWFRNNLFDDADRQFLDVTEGEVNGFLIELGAENDEEM